VAVTRRNLAIGIAAVAVLVALTACGNSGSNQASQSTSSASTSTSGTEAHNQADVTFAQQMIPHHQQAIEMSDIVLAKKNIDPRVVQLANQIKSAQGPEIQQMQNWLAQWGQPTMPMMPSPSEAPSSSGMPGMPSHSMPGMTGMMSAEDMAALQNAQGVEASKLFLQQMIQHHQGAITMAQQEISSGQYPEAVKLARSITTSQQQEINSMQDMLGSL
jgi:uncharacterized protein (DUF305 family)